MIEVRDLTKYYGPKVALQGVSFEADRGDILGLLGPNGAGKSTTMRILTGYLPPTSGTARIAGFDVMENSLEVRRRIGYLPENVPLYTDMTVAAYLDFVARAKAVSPRRASVEWAMDAARVDHVAGTIIGRLSKGYRQRVGLAQAILGDPEVLILDEPTVGLDPNQISETRQLIKALGGDRTIILSTHILPEVEQICERVVIISKGKVVATDTVQNLTNRLRGSEAIAVEVAAQDGLESGDVRQKLEQVPGVSRVLYRETRGERMLFEIESLQGRSVRADVARAVVNSGWGLNELRPLAVSLEEVFLQLTGSDAAAAAEVKQ
jgi:ABC-2 type transport system ATP-binding protein